MIRYLKLVPLFSSLNDKELDAIGSFSNKIKYQKYKIIFLEKEEGNIGIIAVVVLCCSFFSTKAEILFKILYILRTPKKPYTMSANPDNKRTTNEYRMKSIFTPQKISCCTQVEKLRGIVHVKLSIFRLPKMTYKALCLFLLNH